MMETGCSFHLAVESSAAICFTLLFMPSCVIRLQILCWNTSKYGDVWMHVRSKRAGTKGSRAAWPQIAVNQSDSASLTCRICVHDSGCTDWKLGSRLIHPGGFTQLACSVNHVLALVCSPTLQINLYSHLSLLVSSSHSDGCICLSVHLWDFPCHSKGVSVTKCVECSQHQKDFFCLTKK